MNVIPNLGAVENLVVKNLDPTYPTIAYPVLFLVLSLGLLWLVTRSGLRRGYAVAALSVLLTVDVYLPYSTLYDNPRTSQLGHPEARPETAAIESQHFDRDSYRVFVAEQGLSPAFPLQNMMYGWSSRPAH
ncbi:MAG: hypothetical protein ABJF23_09020 [Bryobacteraceae bacterium]